MCQTEIFNILEMLILFEVRHATIFNKHFYTSETWENMRFRAEKRDFQQ